MFVSEFNNTFYIHEWVLNDQNFYEKYCFPREILNLIKDIVGYDVWVCQLLAQTYHIFLINELFLKLIESLANRSLIYFESKIEETALTVYKLKSF